jgi:cell division protein FtsB
VEFSFDQQTQSDNTLGSDKLRKAIERNRAKQARRSARTTTKTAAKADDSWSLPSSSASPSPSKRGTRRTVAANHENVEFTTALRKSKRSPATVDYSATSAAPAASKTSKVSVLRRSSTTRTTPAKRKATSKTRKKILKGTNEAITRGIWVFCAILLVRLIFSDGGVQDFYAKKDVLQDHFNRLDGIENENTMLLKEIEKLESDPQYQKKVVRDHLGYIAKDEYLVLFPSRLN